VYRRLAILIGRAPLSLVLTLVGALVIRVVLVFATPALFAPDEAAHLLYVDAVATGPQLPVQHISADPGQTRGADEFFQPPLFYLVAAPVFKLLMPFGQASVYGVRLLNVVISLAVILMAYRLARRIFPARPAIASTAGTLTGFLPTFAGNSSSVNNDLLAILLVAIAIDGMVATLMSGRLTGNDITRISVIAGLALYAKTSALALVPALLLWAWLLRRQGVARARMALVVPAVALAAIMPWWLLRNQVAYGNLLGVDLGWAHLAGPWPERLTVTLSYLGWSFWAAFGRINEVRPPIPLLLLPWLLLLAAAARALLSARHALPLSAAQRHALLLLGALSCVIVLGTLKFGLDYGQGQGRYLFPALPALAVLTGFAFCDRLGLAPGQGARALAVGFATYCIAVVGLFALPAYSQVRVVTGVCAETVAGETGDYESWVLNRRPCGAPR
jgi:hypothetical protein